MQTKEILKKLRKEKEYSAQQVADGCLMSLGVYKKYESGERGVGTPALCKLADFYGVSTDYLLGRTPVKQMATEQPDPFANIDVSALEKRIIKQYTELEESTRALCIELFLKLNPTLHAVFQEITQQTPEQPIIQSQSQNPPQPVQPPEQVLPPKPDIQISQMRNSEFAIARGGNGMYKPVPTDEQIASFTPVPEDSGL